MASTTTSAWAVASFTLEARALPAVALTASWTFLACGSRTPNTMSCPFAAHAFPSVLPTLPAPMIPIFISAPPVPLGSLSDPVPAFSAGGERHAVARAVRDPEVAVLAARHLGEEVRPGPVDELHQEAVLEGAHDVHGQLVHDVRRDRHLVGLGEVRDPQRLGEPVGATHIGHEVSGGPPLDQIPELEARVVVLAGGHGNPDALRNLGAGGEVVGEHRFLVPDEVEIFQEPGLADVAEDVELLVHVDHEADLIAESLAHGLDALAVHPRVRVVDLHLVVAASHADVALGLADQVVKRVLRPPAAPVRRDPVGHRSPQFVERQAGGLSHEIPEADVERAQGIRRDALTLDPAVRAVHPLPQPRDEERILSEDEWLQAGLEIHLDRLGAAAAEGETVPESGEALVGVNHRDDQPVLGELERHRPGSRNAQDEAVDAGDLHLALRHLEQARGAHAAADAHGADDELRAAALAFDERVADHPGAAHAIGMADRDRAAVDIEPVHRDTEPVATVDDLDGERLVQLPEVDVVHPEAEPLEEPRDREHGTDAHLVRLAGGDGEPAVDPERLEAAALGQPAVHHDAG